MALPKGKILQCTDYNVLVASHEPYIMQKKILNNISFSSTYELCLPMYGKLLTYTYIFIL